MTGAKKILLILFGLLIAASCCAQELENDPERVFHKGNDYYEKGDFSKAMDEYESLLGKGYESLSLYYNLGDAYFKSGDTGKAILNYARALRLAPRDADLKSNYRFVKNMVAGSVQAKGVFWPVRLVKAYADEFTVNEVLWMTTGLYVLLVALLFVIVTVPRFSRKVVTVLIAALLLFAFNAGVAWHKIRALGREAVVIVSEAESRYGPFDTATAYFRLNEGMEVEILNAKGGWVKIKRADGKIGWVEEEDVETI